MFDDLYPFTRHLTMAQADAVREHTRAGRNFEWLIRNARTFGVDSETMQEFVNRNRDCLALDLRRYHAHQWGMRKALPLQPLTSVD